MSSRHRILAALSAFVVAAAVALGSHAIEASAKYNHERRAPLSQGALSQSAERAELGYLVTCDGGDGQVIPCDSTTSAPAAATNQTVAFRLTTPYAEGEEYALDCSISGQITSCLVDGYTDYLVEGDTLDVLVTYSTGAAGTGTITLVATPQYEHYPLAGESRGTYSITVVSAAVTAVVTPDGAPQYSEANALSSATFKVTNQSQVSAGFQLQTACTASLTCVATSPASVQLAPSASAVVTATYTTGAIGTAGTVRLQAINAANAAVVDTGWVVDTAAAPTAPIVDIASSHAGATVERSLCLTAAAGASAAYECGDLRIVHPLPTIRTQDKLRQPVLHYNSQHAQPYPIVAANVVLISSSAIPDSVTASLRYNGAEWGAGHWSRSDWTRGTAHRIAVGFDATTRTTGAYTLTLVVTSWYPSGPLSTSTSVHVAIVNRAASPFGSGWWLAGFERLHQPGTDTMFWVGGDGSTRQYIRSTDPLVWHAEELAGKDSIVRRDGTLYVRALPNRAEVRFDLTGRHISTMNELGHETQFNYTDVTDTLRSITVPRWTSGPAYIFGFQNGRLRTVSAPGPDVQTGWNLAWQPSEHIVTVQSTAGRIESITDPDLSVVQFGYASTGGSNLIVKRAN